MRTAFRPVWDNSAVKNANIPTDTGEFPVKICHC